MFLLAAVTATTMDVCHRKGLQGRKTMAFLIESIDRRQKKISYADGFFAEKEPATVLQSKATEKRN